LIILTFVFVNNSNVARYSSFAVDSLVLGSIVWILDDTLYAFGNMRYEQIPDYQDTARLEAAKDTLTEIFVVRWIGLVVWIAVILVYV
jgi:hypothetical protein